MSVWSATVQWLAAFKYKSGIRPQQGIVWPNAWTESL